MLTLAEIVRSAGAAWALFRGDPSGMRRLDVSVDGFWRSFAVVLLHLPALAIVYAAERQAIIDRSAFTAETFPLALFLASHLARHVVGWFLQPAVLALLARPFGLSRVYAPLVVARNWASLIAMVVLLLPSLPVLFGLASGKVLDHLSNIAVMVLLRYDYMVVRAATGLPVGFSIGLVALDFVLSGVIFMIAGRLTGI